MDAKDDLRDRIRDGLPAGVLALMDEIEAFAGVQIVFAHNPYPPSPGAFAPLAAQVAVRHDVATIYLRDLERTDAQNVAHELLHIQRYWVDRVPQLRPKTDRIPALLKYIQTLENEIEHAAIIPRERTLGLVDESCQHWNATAAKKWGEYPWFQIHDAPSRRDYAIFGRLQLETVTDASTRASAFEIIKREGVSNDAERFTKEMMALLHDKPRSASCVARYLDIPANDLRLLYFDVPNRAFRFEPLPPH